MALFHKGLLLLKLPCQLTHPAWVNKREIWGWLRPFLAWPAECVLIYPIHLQPCASYLSSMVLGKVGGEVDGQEQCKNWSVRKLEWLQTWTEGQAGRLFPLLYIPYRKSRPFA